MSSLAQSALVADATAALQEKNTELQQENDFLREHARLLQHEKDALSDRLLGKTNAFSFIRRQFRSGCKEVCELRDLLTMALDAINTTNAPERSTCTHICCRARRAIRDHLTATSGHVDDAPSYEVIKKMAVEIERLSVDNIAWKSEVTERIKKSAQDLEALVGLRAQLDQAHEANEAAKSALERMHDAYCNLRCRAISEHDWVCKMAAKVLGKELANISASPPAAAEVCDACKGKGYLEVNTGNDETGPKEEIQRCDTCNKFKSDVAAVAAWLGDLAEYKIAAPVVLADKPVTSKAEPSISELKPVKLCHRCDSRGWFQAGIDPVVIVHCTFCCRFAHDGEAYQAWQESTCKVQSPAEVPAPGNDPDVDGNDA